MTNQRSQMDQHREEALMENVAFLLGVGLNKNQVAARLGMARDALDKKIERWRAASGGRISDTSAESEAGRDEGRGEVRPLRLTDSERPVAPPEE